MIDEKVVSMINDHFAKIKAILFDYDGVISESVNVKTKAFAQLYEKYGNEVVSRVVKHHINNGGISRFEKFRLYHSEYLGITVDDNELDKLCNRFSELVLEGVISSPYVSGAHEFIREMCCLQDCFVVSGTPQDELNVIIKKKGLYEYFKEVHGSPRKKSDIINDILDRYKYLSEHVVFIGDSINDYDAAVHAGINFIGRVPEEVINPFPSDTIIIKDFFNL